MSNNPAMQPREAAFLDLVQGRLGGILYTLLAISLLFLIYISSIVTVVRSPALIEKQTRAEVSARIIYVTKIGEHSRLITCEYQTEGVLYRRTESIGEAESSCFVSSDIDKLQVGSTVSMVIDTSRPARPLARHQSKDGEVFYSQRSRQLNPAIYFSFFALTIWAWVVLVRFVRRVWLHRTASQQPNPSLQEQGRQVVTAFGATASLQPNPSLQERGRQVVTAFAIALTFALVGATAIALFFYVVVWPVPDNLKRVERIPRFQARSPSPTDSEARVAPSIKDRISLRQAAGGFRRQNMSEEEAIAEYYSISPMEVLFLSGSSAPAPVVAVQPESGSLYRGAVHCLPPTNPPFVELVDLNVAMAFSLLIWLAIPVSYVVGLTLGYPLGWLSYSLLVACGKL